MAVIDSFKANTTSVDVRVLMLLVHELPLNHPCFSSNGPLISPVSNGLCSQLMATFNAFLGLSLSNTCHSVFNHLL